jgi:hypothetical protein
MSTLNDAFSCFDMKDFPAKALAQFTVSIQSVSGPGGLTTSDSPPM